MLNLRAWEWNKLVSFEKVENALPEQVRDDADVVAEVETVSQVDTLVSIMPVVVGERLQYPQLDPRRVPVLLYGPNYLDCTSGFGSSIVCLHDFSKGSLSE